MLASQCVQIDPSEIALMAERGVRVSHMPLSNCEVGGGIAPLPELLQAGVQVGLGSDSYIDDFFEVMRGAFLIHKASHQDPGVLPAKLVWYLATEGGARVLGFQSVGRLIPGWQADLQLIDASLPTPLTEHNLYDQLLLYRNHSHVRATMVAGRTVMRDGVIPNVEMTSLLDRVHQAATCLWGFDR
jgi:5-methylthioadenosine/S-adenosylhomocysteine deaminase